MEDKVRGVFLLNSYQQEDMNNFSPENEIDAAKPTINY